MSGSRVSPAVFEMDVSAVVAAIERFIAGQVAELGRAGIVVASSGGLDSSTVLALCARAIGPDRVTAVLLPDSRGSRDALRFSRLVARRLGVRVVALDATRVNRAAGVYDFVGYRLPLRRLVARFVRTYLARGADNAFLAGVRGTDHQPSGDPRTRRRRTPRCPGPARLQPWPNPSYLDCGATPATRQAGLARQTPTSPPLRRAPTAPGTRKDHRVWMVAQR